MPTFEPFSGRWDIHSDSREVTPIQGDAHLEPLHDFVHLAAQAVAIRNCDATWEVKHEILFDVILPAVSKTRVKIGEWAGKGYQAGAEKLVNSHVEALEKRAADIRLILDAIDSIPYGGETVAPSVLNHEIAIILEWQEYIRKELENQTGQKWAVAHDFEERSGDVRFICYWQGRNLAMPPLSFHRLASNDNVEAELRERARQVAEARALL